MEAFTHLSILVSVILALGIAALLSGFAQIIEHRRTALIIAAIGLLTTADRVHRLLAYAALLACGSYVALLFSRLS